MGNSESVTEWLQAVERDDREAANHLVERYFKRLVGVARNTYQEKLGGIPRPAEDEEDAALSALESIFAGVREGKIKEVVNRHQLLALLFKVTIRKVYDQRERATAQMRGGGRKPVAVEELEHMISKMPDASARAELADTYRAAMDALGDAELKRIAAMDLEGSSRPEIAEALGMTERTVYRKLKLIHEKWDGLARLWETAS